MDYIEGKLPEREAVRRLYDDAAGSLYLRHGRARARAARVALPRLRYDGDTLCGLLRAVGDGQTILYIQDILVLQQYRRHGIGRTMVKMLLDAYPNVRQRVLLTDETPEMHGFYESLGFFPSGQVGLTAFYYMGGES